MTIFTAGGLILYQYTATPSLFQATDGPALTRQTLNGELLQKILAVGNTTKTYHIVEGKTLVWKKYQQYFIVALYPDIMFEGPRQYLKTWAETLVEQTAHEYNLYYNSSSICDTNETLLLRPDPAPFDKTFRVLLNKSKTEKPPQQQPAATATNTNTNTEQPNASTSNAKMRSWGNAKVTEKSMALLDKSSVDADSGLSKEEATAVAHERALREAREAYLPTQAEVAEEQVGDDFQIAPPTPNDSNSADDDNNNSNSWSSTVTGLFQQMTGNKVLTSADLDAPLQKMEEVMKEKNVAATIAHELCESVRQQLIGKRLNSMYRVQTAVQQALETTLTKLLKRDSVDILRNVLQKRGDGSILSKLSSSAGGKRRPYVITVMGINGIGKTTSLAKLAYYFKQHGCNPLLVAGDTFRSGAVEQLRVHADCLDVPLFSQGYSKDPSAVTQAAIQQATQQGNDVVLVDTAGRMQNNVPLMKALGKLVAENQPDFIILVCEALVGHDGLSQHEMFRQAARRPIDGLILTKFDTVDQKMGAALTLTHETGSPIVFLGVGQKYHHLKKLNVGTVVQSLFL